MTLQNIDTEFSFADLFTNVSILSVFISDYQNILLGKFYFLAKLLQKYVPGKPPNASC